MTSRRSSTSEFVGHLWAQTPHPIHSSALSTAIFPVLFCASGEASSLSASMGQRLAHNPHPLQVSERVRTR